MCLLRGKPYSINAFVSNLFPPLHRFASISYWVATLVVAAGELEARKQVLSKFIQLADVLSDKLGNLVSFMAIMEGLALTQVSCSEIIL